MGAVVQAALVAVALVSLVVAVLALRAGRGGAPAPAAGHPAVAAAAASEAAAALVEPDPAGPPELLAHLSLALDRIPDGVVVADSTGREIFRNATARRLSEARNSQVLVAAAVEELLTEAVAGRTHVRDVELFGPPMQSFVVQSVPFVTGGGLVVVEDHTQDRRTDTVRRDFVANISHELKTPIGALGLLAETIRGEEDLEIIDRLASRMVTEAERASRTIDDLLELSRIEFGDDTEFAEVSVLAIAAEAESRISAAAEQAGVEVVLRVPMELTLVGDRRQIVSAVFNLLDNAVKYSTAGSEVTVTAELTPTGTVRLGVTDVGVGIPQRDLDRIFERFYRVDRARSRETGGTGLGLAIVRHVASNHRGEVSVDSLEGVGSTFTLSLPAIIGNTPAATGVVDRPTTGTGTSP